MAATETRLLLLGAVALFEPVNGYRIAPTSFLAGVRARF